MDLIAPVARSEENPAEPSRREETTSRSSDKSNSIPRSMSPPQKQQQQQRPSHASVATSQNQTQLLKNTERHPDSDTTRSRPATGDGNDRISSDTPAQLPLVVQNHAQAQQIQAQIQLQIQAQMQAQLGSNSLHQNKNSSTNQRAPQSTFQSQMHHQSSVLPHSIQVQQRQMQHATAMNTTGLVQSPQKQQGYVVPTMPSLSHHQHLQQQPHHQQNHRPSPAQLLQQQQQRHLALARTTAAMQHAANTTNTTAAARFSANNNAKNSNGPAKGSLSQSPQHNDIVQQQQQQQQQRQAQQQQLQQRQQQMLNTKRAPSALPAAAVKTVVNNASSVLGTITARIPVVKEAALLSSASSSGITARSLIAQSQSHAGPAGLKGGMPGTVARGASTQQQQQHNLSSSQQQQTQPDVEQQAQTLEQAQQTLYEEQIARQRSVLVDKYSPFIAPADQSLKDARKRLRAALEQTRKLRCSFTKRVYGKYRVCLQPPESSEETIRNIKNNPKAVAKRLEQEIRLVKDEKEFEKKEAQALNAELSKVDQSKLSVSADNAEQLMYLSAGLSLVILPEEKVNAKLLKGYQDRGPINPATGQRVRSISQAAASAGEIILERSRKGAAMRKQWQQQRKLPQSNPLTADNHGEFPQQQQQHNPMDLLITPKNPPATTAAIKKLAPQPTSTPTSKVVRDNKASTIPVVPAVSQQPLPQPRQAPAIALANEKSFILQPAASSTLLPSQHPPMRNKEPPKLIKRPSKMSTILNSAQASSAKFGKSRGGAGISVNISLSLNPTADELSLENSCRASTAALMARSVGTAQGISRASPQQRLRHPHPESSGGRQRASSATSAKRELATLAQNAAAKASGFQNKGAYAHTYLNLALPPLPTPMERRERKPLIVVDETRAASNARAKRSIQTVLENLKDSDSDSSGDGPASTRATKIGFLRGIHKSQSAEVMPKKGVASPAERRIDPSLAFSVLQAIGLITEADTERNETSPVQMDAKVENLKAGSKRKLLSLASLPSKWRKISLSKRARFSDVVFDNRKIYHTAVPAARGTTPTATAPLESIRGGGELPSGSADETTGSTTEADARKANGHAQARSATLENSVASNTQSNNMQRDSRQQQSRWEDASRQSLVMMNSQYPSNRTGMGTSSHVQGTVAGPAPLHHQPSPGTNEAYHHQSGFIALQLAQQLRHANNAMANLPTHPNSHSPGDMQVSHFMSGPYHQAPWSPNGTSAVAMAAAQSSLAALGLQFPMAVYNSVSVQHRSARALLAREQQNVAAAQAVAAHQQSVSQSVFLGGAANPGFAPPSSVMQPPHQGVPNFSSASQAYNARAPSSVVSPPAAAAKLFQTQLQNSRQSTSAASAHGNANDKGKVPPACQETVSAKPEMLVHNKPPPASTRSKPKADDEVVGSSTNGFASLKTSAPSNGSLQGTPAKKRTDSQGRKAAISKSSFIEKATVAESSMTKATQPVSFGAQTAEEKATIPAMNKKGGLRFFLPKAPTAVSPEEAKLVQIGRVHSLLGDRKTDEASNVSEILAYLAAVGTNIPIPKAFILSALKERLNIPAFKHLSTSAGFNFSREVCIVAQPPFLLLLYFVFALTL